MTELKKKTRVKRINLDTNKRLIFVSDIHGDVDTFKDGLKSINFSDDDYLFIIGDICEKGDFKKNLECFRYVMELSKRDNVFPMAGNCDEVLRFILPEDQKDNFLYYTVVREHSILNDIAYEMGYKLSMDMNVREFVDLVQEKYKDLYEFMDSLDDVIIINNNMVLVHGGLDDVNNIPEYALPLLKYDNFYGKSDGVELLTIVGHYPTRNYRHDISCCNPIFDFKKRIISIDGGNHIVKGGQINFVFIDSLQTMNFSYVYRDHYPKHIMKYDCDYTSPSTPVNITYGNNEIEILSTDLDFYYIRHVNSKTCMWVHTSYVYQDEKTNKYYCYDASNQFLSVRKNDEISVIRHAKPYSVIKKNGYIGLIETRYLEDDN